ncbi:alkaline phosphatase PafA [Acidiluteibacter ferrifornacis]|uniref:Alkaline phosphatase family protein n=1 Tax=Acidiluteibacter ferrifornacis TaxID=2692424 RepID=A0A6N9NMQ7_9FLAO|nr:alkaline phosphatase PafA [Acidiluteibacter ferrifornacis]NBG66387.1 alkaline phosphatase family protein [Acidiluteibacter ferrifornacis]
MKSKKLLLTLVFFISLNSFAKEGKPKLIVMLTVDQMRHDYISKYWDRYSENGFKRLVNKGFAFDNANFSYAPTLTAVGHATIGSGTTPVHHGIAANDWYDRNKKTTIYCVEDSSETSVGVKGADGQHSPRNLKANSFTDQLKLNSPKSKVIGISIKDRGAILPVGYAADAAYWLSGDEGKFITSTFYKDELPKWVKSFNSKKHVEEYLKSPWNTLYPIESYIASSADDADFEGKFDGESHSTFPHNLPAIKKESGLSLIKQTPFGNSLLADFAKEAILNEQLGGDSITDVISISFSSTDYIGHMYGPQSIEVEDTYLRLDQEIEQLLTFLDQKVGEKQYLVVLTADHGVADIPAHAKGSTDYYDNKVFKEAIRSWSMELYGADVIERIINHQIYLNYTELERLSLKQSEVKRALLDQLFGYPNLTSAADMSGKICVGDEAICQRMFNGFDPKRSGDIFYSFQPGWLSDYYLKNGGTGHSTAYNYDTHVPMIWFGKDVKFGTYNEEVAIKDIAVTLSALLELPFPNGATGKPLNHFFVTE